MAAAWRRSGGWTVADRHPLGRSCEVALPLVLLLLPYALARRGLACWAQRRSRAVKR